MKTISSIMKKEHDNILLVVEALEKSTYQLEKTNKLDPDFYTKFVGFQRNYADKYHHAKEEEILFPILEAHKNTATNSEINLLVHQHILSKAYMENIEEALAFKNVKAILANSIQYVEMIRDHINREDNHLFPLVEELLPSDVKTGIIKEFEKSEEAFPSGTYEKHMSIAKNLRKIAGINS